MEKEKILYTESTNDGQSIFLFYDQMVGVYVAYGLSAYYVTMVTEPYLSYSEEMSMPVALLSKGHLKYMRGGNLTMLQHIPKTFYHFQMRYHVGDAGYVKWLKRNFPGLPDID